MKILLAVAAIAAAFSVPSNSSPVAVASQSNAWQVDGGHSSVVFKVKHANASWFYGMFTNVAGTIEFDAAKPESSKSANGECFMGARGWDCMAVRVNPRRRTSGRQKFFQQCA